MKTKVIGLGAGGHAKVLMDILLQDEQYEIAGLLDPDPALHGQEVVGVKVLGGDDRLPELYENGVDHFVLGVGSVGRGTLRRNLYELALELGLKPIAVIHPTAIVSKHSRLGDGLTVLAGAVINTEARLGDNVLINTRAVVEHDCEIGNHVHVASGAVLAGGVHIGEDALVGAGAVVRQGIAVGPKAIVGAGAVVVKDVEKGAVLAGNPARPLQKGTEFAADPGETGRRG